MKYCECSLEDIKDKGFSMRDGKAICNNCGNPDMSEKPEHIEATIDSNNFLLDTKIGPEHRMAVRAFNLKQKKRKTSLYWVWGLLAVNTIASVVLFSQLSTGTPDTGSDEIYQAMSNDKINAAGNTNVYQQQVSNGWAIRDLLKVIGTQNATMISNQNEQSNRTNILLLNLLFTTGLMATVLIRVGILVNDSQDFERSGAAID
jgi:hypothetical protein